MVMSMTLKQIVNKYPIVNTNWECSYDYVGSMVDRIMDVTNIHRYDILNKYFGIVGYFTRKRVDDVVIVDLTEIHGCVSLRCIILME